VVIFRLAIAQSDETNIMAQGDYVNREIIMKLFLIIISSIFILGCGSLTYFDNAPGEGKIAFFNYNYEKVWAAAISTVNELQLELKTQDRDQGKIIAISTSAESAGDNVEIIIAKVEEVSATVEVIFIPENKRRTETVDWSDIIIKKIRKILQ
tara:strand:+ start:176 stop:634 length:459 start_codon:yes stop_codon:yes gene_type:complete